MKLVLIRHGQTAANLSAALDTRLPGLPLTNLGQSQAQSMSERFSKEVGDRLDALTVSAMTRTRQTAAPLCTRYGVKPQVSAQIREVSAGDYEMSSSPVAIRVYVEACYAWMNANFAHRMPGAEDGYEFLGRVVPIIRDVMERAYRSGGRRGSRRHRCTRRVNPSSFRSAERRYSPGCEPHPVHVEYGNGGF